MQQQVVTKHSAYPGNYQAQTFKKAIHSVGTSLSHLLCPAKNKIVKYLYILGQESPLHPTGECVKTKDTPY
jgi:hypothetical protein